VGRIVKLLLCKDEYKKAVSRSEITIALKGEGLDKNVNVNALIQSAEKRFLHVFGFELVTCSKAETSFDATLSQSTQVHRARQHNRVLTVWTDLSVLHDCALHSHVAHDCALHSHVAYNCALHSHVAHDCALHSHAAHVSVLSTSDLFLASITFLSTLVQGRKGGEKLYILRNALKTSAGDQVLVDCTRHAQMWLPLHAIRGFLRKFELIRLKPIFLRTLS